MAKTEIKYINIIVISAFMLIRHDTDEDGNIIGIKSRRATELGENLKVAQQFGLECIAAKKAYRAGTEEADEFLKNLAASKDATEKALALAASAASVSAEDIAAKSVELEANIKQRIDAGVADALKKLEAKPATAAAK